ncbi:hypothetical protein PMAYCL1PPCAC_33260, partial [Pristionchus mayeri]
EIVCCDCPADFDIVAEECRGLYTTVLSQKTDTLAVSIEKCQEIEHHPIIIRNIDDQMYWMNNRWSNSVRVIGLMCNNTFKLWQWIDGSAMLFKPQKYDKELDEDCRPGNSWYLFPVAILFLVSNQTMFFADAP